MLLPQEIRNHEFTRAIRGYTTAEVDEYIDFLAEKMELVTRENDELDRKLAIAMNKLEELQAREARIARLDTEMRRAAANLLHEAEKQQKKIVDDANAYAKRITEEADAHVAAQKNLRNEMQEEILRFKNDLYARYGQHIDQLEEIASAAVKTSFGEDWPEAPAVAAPTLESVTVSEPAEDPAPYREAEAAETIETLEMPEALKAIEEIEALEVPEAIKAIEEIEALEVPEAIKAIEEIEALETVEDMEQIDLFDPIDDTEAINKELEEMMAGAEAIWTDYTDAVADDEMDPGFALPEAGEEEEFPEEAFFDEPETSEDTEPESPSEEDDTLLLQNLRRAFSVEFDTFDSTKSSSKKQPEDEDEFAFVENEAPKKRGFLSRLIGGDSDED